MSKGSLARKTRSAKSIKTDKFAELEVEVAALRNDLANLRATYSVHTHIPVVWGTGAGMLYRAPGWYWNGYQYVWG